MSGAASLIDQVRRQLHDRGERMTSGRRAVLEAMSETPGHLSAEEIYAAVAARDGEVHPSSIYRTLEALSRLGVIQHIHLGHGATAYHLSDDDAHLHAQCRECGLVVDLPADLLADVATRVREALDFELDAAHTALSGVCRDCAGRDGHH